MLVAAIYARKSTDQSGVADDQKSVARQIEHARQYATSKGWTVADEHVYVDDGISGAEFANRPGFLRLMNALKPRAPFQVLVMSEESRLGREQIEVGYALKQLITAGVRVFCYLTDTERTLNSPIEKAMLALQTMADEMEREKARQRTSDAMIRKARAGHVCGGRVFGYDNVEIVGPDGRRSHVERRINEPEAAVIRQIFQLAKTGRGLTTIAKLLNEQGAPSPRPQQDRPAGWAPSSVREVLRRALYRGEIVWNRTAKRDRWGAKNRQSREEDQWIRIPVPALAIVPPDLWRAAHGQMQKQRDRYSPTSPHGAPPWSAGGRYLLTGLLRCSVCQGGLEARSRSHGHERKVFYGCATCQRRGRTVCGNSMTVSMELADEAIISTVQSGLLHPPAVEAAVNRAAGWLRAGRHPGARDAMKRDLASIDRELANLTAATATAGGDVQALVSAMREREARRRALSEQLAQVSVGVEFEPKAVLAELQGRLNDWRELLRADVPRARGLLKQLIVGRVMMEPDRDCDCYRFHGTGTMLPLLDGIIPAVLSTERSVPNPTPGVVRGARYYVPARGLSTPRT